jgi:hypothetical protein
MKEQQQRFVVVARPGKYKIMDGTDISAREAATSFFLPISTVRLPLVVPRDE